MIQLELRPELVESLKGEAQARATSVDTLVNQWLTEQLWREKHKKIQEEAEKFRAQHAALLQKYAGRYVAMRDGEVIDHDVDLVVLNRRIRAKFGDAAILMTLVNDEPIQTINVLGARHTIQ